MEPPIRAEIFGPQRFAQHGRSLAKTHEATRASSRTAGFFPRLMSNVRTLRDAQRYIGMHAATGYDISPAGEWLLDNFHLIERQLKEIHEGLPRSYFRSLPMLVDAPLAGLPRIYGVAWAFVAHTDGAFDEDLLVHFLGAYQEERELSLSEMWALPTTLRVVLIENLRRLAERVATNKAAREAANLVCDRIESYTVHALDELLAALRQRGVGQVFLTQMAQRLQDRRVAGEGGHQARYQGWLRHVQPDMAALQTQQAADQAADNLSVSNAVTSLRAIGDVDWPDIVARTSALMRLMLTSPVFEAEHVATRDRTLHRIESLARRSGHSEVAVAGMLLGLMDGADGACPGSDVADHWLHGSGRPRLVHALGLHEPLGGAWRLARRYLALPAYLGALGVGTVSLVRWLLVHDGVALADASPWLILMGGLLMCFPASEAVVAVINRLIGESTRPRHLPRLALLGGIPAEHRVMVVIPGMLTNPESVSQLVHRLHLHRLANPEPNAQFALLTDWADADSKCLASDAGLLDSAVRQIQDLNARFPAPIPNFIVLHRERQFSASERSWIGWERKRGKLSLLVTALAEGHSTAFIDLGEASRMASGVRYIVTLDSDTQLPPGRLRELVGVAAHPHNQPRLDAQGRNVVGGYGILQPRTVTPLPSRHQLTPFHWLFAGQCGIDPYSAASSEVYQDVFEEGSFNGKGLLNVRAMHAVLSGRLPEGQVLSHDLIEGAMARCAAVTDIHLIEDAPFHADVAAARIHRWTRGDWQLLPYLLSPSHQGLRAINLWKLFDNLRRSLVAPMSLLLWMVVMSGQLLSPWATLALVLAAFSAGPLMGAMAGFLSARTDLARRHFHVHAAAELLRVALGAAWHLGQLLQQALMSIDAIIRALFRLFVSHRHLLQWTTAASSQAAAKSSLRALLRQHWAAPLAAALIVAAMASVQADWAWVWSLCGVWALSPVWTWLVSRPGRIREEAPLSTTDALYLEGLARDTWRFFERCVGTDDRHLPPDNLQTSPFDAVAHRTSPTNIGLYLLSAACARQFGWIGTRDLIARIQATLLTLSQLQRHRGHFLNWYDTQSGEALLPMYVSTVDSGNLSGHLLAVAQACRELAVDPFNREATQLALVNSKQRMAPLIVMRSMLSQVMRDELTWLMADHRATTRSAALDAEARTQGGMQGEGAEQASSELLALAEACEQLAGEADFSFLYHPKRHLLHLGYRVAEQQLDAGFYDLLASESRLTGLLAIAKGDVPVSHWNALGRPFYAMGRYIGLRSWSGSMFEYLMPGLVIGEPHGSALHDACEAALQEQMDYARGHGLPWGISESAYAARDHTLAYQYAPHGVPRLALRRTPSDEWVIAPYATALAAQISPRAALDNFRVLQKMGARARYGFIEALDFSPASLLAGEPFTPVNTFMAHHQGMSIVSLANVLKDGVAQRWGMANAHIEAVASLLHERTPHEVSVLSSPPVEPTLQLMAERPPGLLRHVLPGMSAVEPTHLLSNGRYHVAIRPNGSGWSRRGDLGIHRWRDDALRDAQGSYLYVRRGPDDVIASLTQHPAPDASAHYQSTFHADRVCFDARWPDVRAQTTVWVSPEDDIEFRQVELCNLGGEDMSLELISAFDVALSDARADEAHPAFMNLFVQMAWQAHEQALVMTRKPRLPSERTLHAAHFVADADGDVISVRWQTDRQRWLGRNHDVSQPWASFEQGGAPTLDAVAQADLEQGAQPQNTGLDPVCVLSVSVRMAPLSKVKITFATAASDDMGTLQAVVDKYRQRSHIQRASLMSTTLTSIRLHALRIAPDSFAAFQSLSTALALTLTRLPLSTVQPHPLVTTVCDKRLLWSLGISGDRPIILVSVGVMQGLGMLRSLAQALRLWSWGGLACDLVVVNAEPSSYNMPLHREILALRDRHASDSGVESATGAPAITGYCVLHAEELSVEVLSTLQTLARVRLQADGRPLQHHVLEWVALHDQAWADRSEMASMAVPVHASVAEEMAAPAGEFLAESGDFAFSVHDQLRPTRPWINVLSNPAFGAQVSEVGGGYSWAVNSRSMKLTAWSNDPVGDPPSEWFLLQDASTLETWSVAPSAWGAEGVAYQICHAPGSTVITHEHRDLRVTASWCVDPSTSVKQVRVGVRNLGLSARRVRVIGMAEWLMGVNRTDRASTFTSLHRQRMPTYRLTALLCTQLEQASGFGGGTAFLALSVPTDETEDWTCDRRECFDARGQLVLPDHLGRRCGAGLDPCAMLSTRVSLAEGDEAERVFLLGYGPNAADARQVAEQAACVGPAHRLADVHAAWQGLLGATQVKTPDPLLDVLVNRWLLYQAVSCRMWAKAGFYQAGGATGFRDQLQDAMALSWARPELLRAQIVLAASRQFPQGDVQHWWHAPDGAGVRTHFSDDLLWLPCACVRYLKATADLSLLDQAVPFIEGTPIPDGAEDAYFVPMASEELASVYEHAARAIDHSLRVGAHGLPLMGTGDWNDGMNRVGSGGRGESVWLGWFLCQLVAEFAPLARGRGEEARAERWAQSAASWRMALNTEAWDGQWFKRAYFDDGQALGSHVNAEAQIDLIAQAWSVLSGAGAPDLQRLAMASVDAQLVDHAAGLIRLIDPPFVNAEPSAGYIQAYPPGVRENGSQYAHAGVWALMAQARLALDVPTVEALDRPYSYFCHLSPAHRARHPMFGAAYGLEPYVMAGDVYSQAPYVGRGGWSWYTGAAAWLHRAAIESLFGLQQEASTLCFTPCLPADWPRADLTLRRDGRAMHFILVRPSGLASLVNTNPEWARGGAQILHPGQALDWLTLTSDAVFAIPLAEALA